MTTTGYTKLEQCRDEASLDELKTLLDGLGIPWRLESTGGQTATAWMGQLAGHGTAEPVVEVSVPEDRLEEARLAREEQLTLTELPEDHYLHRASAEEIAAILADPFAWSAFDAAHARRLAEERGIAVEVIWQQQAARLQELEAGRPVSPAYLFFAFFFALCGGIAGIFMGSGIANARHPAPLDHLHLYDAASRQKGRRIMILGAGVLAALMVWATWRKITDF